jgi:phosphoglycerate dehydrogenase-like enzyme
VTWLAARTEVVQCPQGRGALSPELLGAADALVVRTYTQVDESLLQAAPALQVVGRAGVGLDNIDLEACRRRGVAVVYSPDANTAAVAEYVTALILDAMRPRLDLKAPVDAATFHRHRRELVGTQLDTLTLGILGFGRIGRRLGRIAGALGMKVLACDLLSESQLRAQTEVAFEYVDRDALLARSDVLSVHVDGRPANRGLIERRTLAALKPTCLLINTSRGMVVEADALAGWAAEVAPSGGRAVLDVLDPEPPPPPGAENPCPLFGLPNVRLLPHIASRTRQAMQNMSWVVKDVWEVLEGREPTHRAE